ncbi:hypothetical protein J2S90_002201 [Arthrobacter bambusae]|uniref:Uncharacterized protein n=1 Tax=Arthrobacter bambusae TaxID=1338426 RepID=A0AAW8DG27_9MICC|nr:hypothetical protein [Arthrobacter bambusae]MDQ0129287.1 hypothetical protein [Arthrobacter bambusae]MDQ0180367.1 hypothetical protein [Arthrobacter bambusae]
MARGGGDPGGVGAARLGLRLGAWSPGVPEPALPRRLDTAHMWARSVAERPPAHEGPRCAPFGRTASGGGKSPRGGGLPASSASGGMGRGPWNSRLEGDGRSSRTSESRHPNLPATQIEKIAARIPVSSGILRVDRTGSASEVPARVEAVVWGIRGQFSTPKWILDSERGIRCADSSVDRNFARRRGTSASRVRRAKRKIGRSGAAGLRVGAHRDATG